MASKSLRIKITGSYDLEGFSFELQKMLARLQDRGVKGVQACSIYLELLDDRGCRMDLSDADGKRLDTFDVSAG